MTIQRKRVAKRLASGLLAGALALGGLAISGGTASAKTPSSPSTNRLYGDDRYETAVAVARNQIADIGNANNGLIIASGESPYDALAGSVLSSQGDRPMVLVKKDSIPDAVADLLSDYRVAWSAASPTFYVLGGTSAISADVYDAIVAAVTVTGDVTPPTVRRISGDDRYATAKAISEVTAITSASDKLIIVSGENGRWADAISAGFISAETGWPIVLTDSTGLAQASAKAVVDAYIALGGAKSGFLIIGGPVAVPSSVETYLIETKLQAPRLIRRIGGADRYQTNFLVNSYARGDTGSLVGYSGATVALASGEAPFDALAAASWAARKNSHILLSPAAGGNAFVSTLSTALGGLANSAAGTNATLYVIGGRNAVSDAAKNGYIGASQGTNLTASLTCPTSGNTTDALSATLVLSGRLTSVEDPHFVSNSASAKVFKNGSTAYTEGNVVVSDLGALINGEKTRLTYDVSLPATTAVGDVITFAGWTEGAALNGTPYSPTRSIGSASCTYLTDVTRPTITSMRALGPASGMTTAQGSVTTSAGPRIIAEFSEAVELTAAGLIQIVGGTTTNSIVTKLGSSGTKWLVQWAVGNAVPTLNSTEVEFVASKIVDKNGLSPASVPRATVAYDAAPATLSVSAVGVTNSTQVVIDAGDLRFTALTAANGGSILGAAGSAWRLSVVNSRGLQAPTVSIDGTAKTITVTADTGYHTVADVANAYTSTFDGDWSVTSKTSTANTTKASATLVPAGCVTTCGEDHVTLTISGNEPFTLGGGVTVNVNGLGVGYVASTAVASDNDYGAALDTNRGRYSQTVTFTSKLTGEGTVAVATANDGANDTQGNRTPGPLSFTLG